MKPLDNFHVQCVCGHLMIKQLPRGGSVNKFNCDICIAEHELYWDSPIYIIHRVHKRIKDTLNK